MGISIKVEWPLSPKIVLPLNVYSEQRSCSLFSQSYENNLTSLSFIFYKLMDITSSQSYVELCNSIPHPFLSLLIILYFTIGVKLTFRHYNKGLTIVKCIQKWYYKSHPSFGSL